MPGKMGAMMQKNGFKMNGMSKIYAPDAIAIHTMTPEVVASEVVRNCHKINPNLF